MPLPWNEYSAELLRGTNYVLTTHVNPDGDGLGAAMALGLALQQCGKTVRLINTSTTPHNYEFMNNALLAFERYEHQHAAVIAAADTIVVIDMNDAARLRTLRDPVMASAARKFIVDHHLNPEPWASHLIVDTDACASGEMAFRLIDEMPGATFTLEIAEALYAAIMTDTGSFRFPRTDPEVHRMIARLLECGVDPTIMYERVYNQSSVSRLQLLGRALSGIRLEFGGAMALLVVTKEMFKETGAQPDDVEEFVQQTLMIRGTQMGCLLVELHDGVKLSFRSKGTVHINVLAGRFGGGGHAHAAGARVHGRTLGDVVAEVLAHVSEVLHAK